MLRFLADENLESALVAALRRDTAIDIVRVQDEGLAATDDSRILERAAREDRVLLTHDAKTMLPIANARVRAGLPLAGVIMVPTRFKLGEAAETIRLYAYCSLDGEWEGRVEHLHSL